MTRPRLFWSVYCILLGLALLIKLLFRLEFSAWNAALALLFLESGLFLIAAAFGLGRPRTASGGTHAFFAGRIVLTADAPALSLLLSTAEVDLIAPLPKLTTVRCAFSTVTIRLPEGWSVRTVCRSALSTVTTPHDFHRGFFDHVCIIGDGFGAQMELKCFLSEVRILD